VLFRSYKAIIKFHPEVHTEVDFEVVSESADSE
jgi:hypothetical protein